MSQFQTTPLAPLLRLGAWGAVAGGGLRMLAALIPYAANSPLLETLYAVIDIGLLFGLIAIYLDGAAAAGKMGLTGFAIALAGTASIVGPDARAFGIDFYLAGSLVLLAGLSLLAVAFWRAGHQVRPAQAWLFSAVLAIAGGALAQPLLIAVGGLLFGLGFVLAGLRISS